MNELGIFIPWLGMFASRVSTEFEELAFYVWNLKLSVLLT